MNEQGDLPTICPFCQTSLDGGDVFEVLRRKNGTAKAKQFAPYYGWTDKTRTRFSKAIAVYDRKLDRTVEYICPGCSGVLKKIEVIK